MEHIIPNFCTQAELRDVQARDWSQEPADIYPIEARVRELDAYADAYKQQCRATSELLQARLMEIGSPIFDVDRMDVGQFYVIAHYNWTLPGYGAVGQERLDTPHQQANHSIRCNYR